VARHPVRVNRPLRPWGGPWGILPHVVDVHTRPCRGGSANRWHGAVPNPGWDWLPPDHARPGADANQHGPQVRSPVVLSGHIL